MVPVVLAVLAIVSLTVVTLLVGAATNVAGPSTGLQARGQTPGAAVEFLVTFSETGLPVGSPWNVTLNGTTQSASAGSNIVFSEPNGTYRLYTWDVKGYESYANVTAIHVSGAAIDITVYYHPPARGSYFITFVQTGLPMNVYWTIQLSAIINGTDAGELGQNYAGPTHTPPGFDGVLNGTFAWTAAPSNITEFPGDLYYPIPSHGQVVISGSSMLINLTFRYSYAFTFIASGLPTSTSWTLQVLNETFTSSGGANVYLTLEVPNGTYTWNATAPGYQTQSGTITILGSEGSNVQGINFQGIAQAATFPYWAWGALGVVIVAAVVGLVLLRRRGHCAMASRPPPPTA